MRKVLLLLLLPAIVLFASCESEKVGSGNQLEPYISEIVTDYGDGAVPGKLVTLRGVNFSPVISQNKVNIGIGLDADHPVISEATETKIAFVLPSDYADGQYKVSVTTNGKQSNLVTLVVKLSLDPTLQDTVEDQVDISALLNASQTVKICDGVEWISFHGNWEGQVRNINIVKTTLNEHNKVALYHDYTEYRTITQKCEYLDAVVGTNGPMQCCHYVRVDGVQKRAANEQDPWITNAAVVIDNGVPDIVEVTTNFDAAARLKNQTVGVCGPMLVYGGKIVEDMNSFKEEVLPKWKEHASWESGKFIYTTHPRTAFGLSKDQKTVYQVAVDGRWTSSNVAKRAIGMPTKTLAKLMRGLGCYKAVNFDGGGGTAMWIYRQGNNGIVNHPCDDLNWDNPTLRACGTGVYIKSDLKK